MTRLKGGSKFVAISPTILNNKDIISYMEQKTN